MATCSSSLTCINPSASHISLQPQITRQRCIYSDPVFPTDRTCPQQPGCSARLILGHQKGVGVQENSRLGDIRHRCSLRSTAPTNPSADRQGPQASKRRLAERFACRVSEEGKETGVNKQADDGPPYGVLSMLALWLFWAGLAYYAFAIAPNQTPVGCLSIELCVLGIRPCVLEWWSSGLQVTFICCCGRGT